MLLGTLIGPKGEKGDVGLKGDPGKDGRDGVDGIGIPGPIGPQGIPGISGLPGRDGVDGVNGRDGIDGIDGAIGSIGPAGPIGQTGVAGPVQTQKVVFLFPLTAASAVATNLAVNAVNAVSDPNLRQVVDLRGMTKCRIHGRFGGTVNAATRLRLQYHLGGNIAVASGDASWQTLVESAGSHVANTMFYSAELSVPLAAQVQHCIVRAVLFSGDGVADPTVSCCIVNFY